MSIESSDLFVTRRGVLVTVNTEQAPAGDVAGMEVEVGGAGIWVARVWGNDIINEKYVLTIDATSQFDANIEVITPLCVFGSGAIQSVIRTGEDSGGTTVYEGGWVLHQHAAMPHPFYVPAGKFVTLRRTDANTILKGGLQFFEG